MDGKDIIVRMRGGVMVTYWTHAPELGVQLPPALISIIEND
jgi:hypothetical protein